LAQTLVVYPPTGSRPPRLREGDEYPTYTPNWSMVHFIFFYFVVVFIFKFLFK